MIKDTDQIDERRVNNIEELANICQELQQDMPVELLTYAFRGVSKKSYKLEATIHRRFDGKFDQVDIKEKLRTVESIAKKKFREKALQLLPSHIENKLTTDIMWLQQMQHYGAPTRLLDWSESLYVAAYFACNDNYEEDGAVWIVHIETLLNNIRNKYGIETISNSNLKHLKLHDNNCPPQISFIRPGVLNERIIAQQGIFSFSPDIAVNQHEMFMDLMCENSNQDITTFCKLIIPKEVKRNLLNQFHLMNVTASSLFPGIDGLGRYIKETVDRIAGVVKYA